MSTNIEESAEFRLHIHNLLYDYSKTHITTDYISFTEDLVSEFIENLRPIPLTDSYSLTLAVDPFETFTQKNLIHSLPPYDEIPQTTPGAVAYLKGFMRTKTSRPKTERMVQDDNYGHDKLEEPLFPALTRKARQQTPKLGQKKGGDPQTLKHVLEAQRICVLEVEPVVEPVVNLEDVLRLKHQIDAQEVPAVKALLQTTTDMLRPQKLYKNKFLDPTYLRNDFQSDPVQPEELFTPIFPKVPIKKKSKSSEEAAFVPSGFKDLVANPSIALKPTPVEDPDGDISLQNLMVTVDGWETIKSSPPSTPSSGGSDDDQVDQLYLPSTPDTEPTLAIEVDNAKMDEVLLPRSRKIGGNSGVAPHILHGKTLASFLKPLLPPLKLVEIKKRSNERSPSPPPSSMLGQPPSALVDDDADHLFLKGLDDVGGLESDLVKLYQGHNLENFILNETIDDKQSLMMEVPDLPPPNIHPPNGMHVPKAFTDFLIPSVPKDEKKTHTQADLPPHQFLKKVKGLQSLGLALSWVTFTVDKKLPSVLEIVDVVELFPEERRALQDRDVISPDSDYAKAMKLLESMDPTDRTSEDGVPMFMKFEHEEPTSPPLWLDNTFKILPNRQERRRLAQLENRAHEYDNDVSDDAIGTAGLVVEEQEHTVEDYVDIGHRHERVGDEEDKGDEGEPERKRLKLDPEADEGETQPFTTRAFADDSSIFGSGSPKFEMKYDEDDKENFPPFSSSSFSEPMDESSDFYFQDNRYDLGTQPVGSKDHNQNESFEPLSFDSRPIPSSLQQSSPDEENWRRDEGLQGRSGFEHLSLGRVSPHSQPENYPVPSLDTLPRFSAFPDLEITSHSLGISAFAQLRARKVSNERPSLNAEPTPHIQPLVVSDEPIRPPAEIFDSNTLSLPETISVPQSVHRYMASLELIQKQAFVRALKSDICGVEVVERETLGGVDLILDPNCAVLLLSLFTLPARCEAYVEKVTQQSWNFRHLLVVFEAYTEQQSRRSSGKPKGSGSAPDLNAYTAPILKAIKKFRRDVNIAEACGTKRPEMIVQYAFANTVDEAALLTRWYGDLAEGNDETDGAIWGQRVWLMQDYLEEEEMNLATIDGLNHFSASIVLCQVSLQDLLNMSPEQRTEGFGGFVGLDAITRCNADLEARLAIVHSSSGTLSSE